MSDEKYPERKYKMPIESVPLTADEEKLYKRLKAALAKRDDLIAATDLQLISHVRRFKHLGTTEEETSKLVLEKLVAMLQYRAKLELDKILETPWSDKEVSFEKCCEVWPIFVYKRSEEGLPVVYDLFGGSGNLDLARKLFIESPKGGARLTEYLLRIYENLRAVCRSTAEKRKLTPCQLYKFVLVIDCKNIDLLTFNSIRALVQKVTADVQLLYPDTVRRAYLINTNWLFRGVWTLACLFIDEITQAKFQILGYDFLDTIVSQGILLEEIPELVGGKCPLKPVLGKDIEFSELSPVLIK